MLMWYNALLCLIFLHSTNMTRVNTIKPYPQELKTCYARKY
jgi:hypothetical protein